MRHPLRSCRKNISTTATYQHQERVKGHTDIDTDTRRCARVRASKPLSSLISQPATTHRIAVFCHLVAGVHVLRVGDGRHSPEWFQRLSAVQSAGPYAHRGIKLVLIHLRAAASERANQWAGEREMGEEHQPPDTITPAYTMFPRRSCGYRFPIDTPGKKSPPPSPPRQFSINWHVYTELSI